MGVDPVRVRAKNVACLREVEAALGRDFHWINHEVARGKPAPILDCQDRLLRSII